MSHRVEAAYAGPDYTPLPAHPAPDANAWGVGQSNVHAFTATAAAAYVFQPHADVTLLQIYVDGPVRMLANGGADISGTGFPLAAAGYYSYSIDPGVPVVFQAVGDDVHVTVLEG
jgi:hypothetical protein